MSELSFSSVCGWLKFRHLLLIDTLGRTRNMHLAAQQMNLSQPAISKMLKEIESLLGFALFERQPRSMPPTALGEHVLRYAQIALNDARSFVEQISSLREGGHGHLKVGGILPPRRWRCRRRSCRSSNAGPCCRLKWWSKPVIT
jgi:DNA-binding transcriptional LysR family regulator